ncbi:hypothetical protein P691DRAFT_783034 [Macrolepiota fuliginosa MF-IS2]|uniref:Uncharacterized protein n=1 Tax=Macrolepiota fuliginosa MF-IS2 TaxID=1400762 RepID=A0A9P5XBX5_9AGAR|nr:hypothetical protein P691DRAFT_783034 [Macrolepiota fuliginosa MF-IS2]
MTRAYHVTVLKISATSLPTQEVYLVTDCTDAAPISAQSASKQAAEALIRFCGWWLRPPFFPQINHWFLTVRFMNDFQTLESQRKFISEMNHVPSLKENHFLVDTNERMYFVHFWGLGCCHSSLTSYAMRQSNLSVEEVPRHLDCPSPIGYSAAVAGAILKIMATHSWYTYLYFDENITLPKG